MKTGSKTYEVPSQLIHAEIAYKGASLGYRVWQKRTDPTKLLYKERLLQAFPEVVKESRFIDSIWFKGDREMPFVFKVSSSKDIFNSICRLHNFGLTVPSYYTVYVLIIPNDKQQVVQKELEKPIFDKFHPIICTFSELNSCDLFTYQPL